MEFGLNVSARLSNERVFVMRTPSLRTPECPDPVTKCYISGAFGIFTHHFSGPAAAIGVCGQSTG